MEPSTPFADLRQLSDEETQRLLREVDQADLLAAMSATDAPGRERFLSNMSARVRAYLEGEMAARSAQDPALAAQAQVKILQCAARLAELGQIVWPKGGEGAPSCHDTPTSPPATLAPDLRAALGLPLEQLELADLRRVFAAMVELAHSQGILALEPFTGDMADPLFRRGLELVVDGIEPAVLAAFLDNWSESRLRQMRARLRSVAEGLVALQSGDSPQIIEAKLEVIY